MPDYFISCAAVQRKTFWRKGEEARAMRLPCSAALGARCGGGGARRGTAAFFFGFSSKNGQILPMGDVPLTGAACLGAEGLPLTGRAGLLTAA